MLNKIFIIVIFLYSSLCSHEFEDVSLQLKWKYQFQFAGYLVAKERGFYEDAGIYLDIKEFNTDIDVVEDVLNDRATFGVGDSSLILDVMKGKKITALMAVFQHSPYILMGAKSPDINSLEDLNTKTLGLYSKGNASAIVAMLKANNIEYKFYDTTYNFNRFEDNAPAMQVAYISNEPFIAKEKGIDIVIFNPKDYGFDSYGDILFASQQTLKNNPQLVEKFSRATVRGWEYAFSHVDEVVEMIYKKYNSLNKSKKALKYEALSLKNISGYGENFGELSKEKVNSIANIYSFLVPDRYNLKNLKNFIYKKEAIALLTTQEIEYLKEHRFNMCIDADAYPLEFVIDETHMGISADMFKLIQKIAPLKTKIVSVIGESGVLKNIQKGRCDLKTILVHEHNIAQNSMFETIPWMKDNLVLISKDTNPYATDIRLLKGKTIVVTLQAYKNFLKKYYPSLNVVVDTDKKNIVTRIMSGEYYAVALPSLYANVVVRKYGLGTLKVVMNLFQHSVYGSIGVNKKDPKLLAIMNKLIESISKDEIENIIIRWNTKTYHSYVDNRMIMQLVGIFILIILIILFAYIKQRKLIKSIKVQKDKFKNIFDKSSDGVAILEDGVFVECNNSLVSLFGYENREQVLNLSPSKISPKFQPDGQKSLEKYMLMLRIASEYGVNHFEWIHLRADGEEFWADIVLTNISTKDNQNLIHVVLRDIGFKKELEEELLELNMQLEERVEDELEKNKKQQFILMQQSRLAQMGEMISMIAHQWRQPLNVLSLATQGIYLKFTMNKLTSLSMEHFNTTTKKQIQEMSTTIDDFREFFKPQKEKKIFEISKTIEHVIEITKPIYKSQEIKLAVDIQKGIFVNGYSNELGQALINIINNAKDALVENNVDKKKFVEISTEIKDDMVLIVIEDNAGGIDDKVKDKIFDPYFSTKSEKNGTGIGLYMSKMIIDEHMNGEIKVLNTQNGAKFIVTLHLEEMG